ncbi:DUF262 domain-containing protein [Vibrio parahaemolyticus]|nr:DUF262 domain-containing protein [Vibrio parahaemolyticus]
MDFRATPVTVDNLFSLRKQYIVPRNQREFSWQEELLEEFWYDLVSNITFNTTSSRFEFSEYFIGAIVLAGDEDGFEQQIVDGQQRITVITTLICSIVEELKKLDDIAYAKGVFDNYIEGALISEEEDPTLEETEAPKYFKLERKSESNYYKLAIQSFEKHQCEARNREDNLLADAWDFFENKLKADNLTTDLLGTASTERADAIRCLKAIAVQLTRHIKVIKVVVANKDDAYIIFEILNARGMDLDAADLIKNKLFSELRKNHPIDFAQTGWNSINSQIADRNKNFKMVNYVRHWWNAHYPVSSESSLYKNFKDKLISGDFTAEEFLENLQGSVGIYAKILDPRFDDWRENNSKHIFYSLNSLKVFNVSICRPLILSMFEAFAKRKIRQSKLIEMLQVLEFFHFSFNAICSQRPSGVENIYSSYARQVLSAETRGTAATALEELKVKLRAKVPSRDLFIRKFTELKFTKTSVADKKLIQYIFFMLERHERGSVEVVPLDMTLEHIMSQKTNHAKVGKIGNLLPLGSALNNKADTKPFSDKIALYQQSNFELTKSFSQNNLETDDWTAQHIDQRTTELARLAYDHVWKF